MTDPQAVWNWASAHLQALLFVVKVHGRAALAWLKPPLQAALGWADDVLQAAIGWGRPAVRHTMDAAQPYAAAARDFLAVYGPQAALTAAAVIAGIVLLVWRRHRRRVSATLVDATLDRDPKTDWFTLNIVMQNFQSHALVVHSLRIERPADTTICEHWQAWQPSDNGVMFIAPALALTNEAEIERTILPRGAGSKYHQSGARRAPDGDDDQLTRSFYLRAPALTGARRVRLSAVVHCELQTRKGRTQDFAFHRDLEIADPGKAATRVT